jgi:hypothetical protein
MTNGACRAFVGGSDTGQFRRPLGGVLGGGEILHSGDHDGREGTRRRTAIICRTDATHLEPGADARHGASAAALQAS